MLVQNIPDNIENKKDAPEEIENTKSIDNMDTSKPSLAYIDSKAAPSKIENRYILCKIDNKEITIIMIIHIKKK